MLAGTVFGLSIAGMFIAFFARQTGGTCVNFLEQASVLKLSDRFEDFPASGSTRWLRYDQMRENYRVYGEVSSLQAYLDWRFRGEESIDVDDINLDVQRDPVIVGSVGDRYFIDEFTDSGRGFRFRVLENSPSRLAEVRYE